MFLLAFAFAGLIGIAKVSVLWSLTFVIVLFMLYVAFRHPHGRADWPIDLKGSLYFLVTTILLLLMIYVMYLASASISIPQISTTIMWLGAVIIGILVILGIIFPRGVQDTRKA